MSEDKKQYKLKFIMLGKEYKTKGDTILEALQGIPLSWEQIKAKGQFILTKGSKKREHLLYLRPLRRVFVNKTAMLLLAKRLEVLLQ